MLDFFFLISLSPQLEVTTVAILLLAATFSDQHKWQPWNTHIRAWLCHVSEHGFNSHTLTN